MNPEVKFYIDKLELQKHPEGGYYKEVYRSDEIILKETLPGRYGSDRNYLTSIYFLLVEENVSLFHKIKSDEIWHFYDGSTIKIYILKNDGVLSVKLLGRNLESGESLQVIIKKDTWFCAEVVNKKSFGIVGCTVAPGFDFNDFKLAEKDELIKNFPNHKELIKRFTK
ncbi:MAG TPA: cupin domain-containing protein [Ignavibacteria bacterium]|nr:cupin domain-containing protein [Ignavibacteria bacterium]